MTCKVVLSIPVLTLKLKLKVLDFGSIELFSQIRIMNLFDKNVHSLDVNILHSELLGCSISLSLKINSLKHLNDSFLAFYCPPMKFLERNIFSRVCLSVILSKVGGPHGTIAMHETSLYRGSPGLNTP